MLTNLEPHPIALEYIPISEDELRQLGEDILRHGGPYEKITVMSPQNGEGDTTWIVDGVQRVRAMVLVGLELKDEHFEEYTGERDEVSLRGFVRSKNYFRRHLTPAQKREKAREILAAHPERSDRAVAKEAGTGRRTVASARAEVAAGAEANGAPRHKDEQEPREDVSPATPRVERGVTRAGTQRRTRGRKPDPPEVRQAKQAADLARRRAARATAPATVLPDPRVNWIKATSNQFKSDTYRTWEEVIQIGKDYVVSLSETQRNMLVKKFCDAMEVAPPLVRAQDF